jgi:hydroxyacylglutathione hydrolase
MEESLLDVLGALPDDTKVYCGHEYTKSNLLFAQSIEPENQAIQAWLERSRKSPMTIPSTIGEEKLMNPFMRVRYSLLDFIKSNLCLFPIRDPAMQKRLGVNDSVEAMAKLREMKNQFRAE